MHARVRPACVCMQLPQVVVRETGHVRLAPAHTTTFYVMAARSAQGVPPGQQAIGREFALLLVELITAEGARLEEALARAGVVTGRPFSAEWVLHRATLQKLFRSHAVVMTGHFPAQYWPRIHRGTGAADKVMLCTCQRP